MAAFDATSSGTTGAINATTVTFSHTCTGANRVLVVFVQSSAAPTGVTYATIAMTQVGTATTNSTGFASTWIISAPASGANNVVVTCGSAQSISAASISANGARQTTTVVSSIGSSPFVTTTYSVAVTTVSANAILLEGTAIAVNTATAPTVSNGQTPGTGTTSSAGNAVYNYWKLAASTGSYTEGYSQSPFTNSTVEQVVIIEDVSSGVISAVYFPPRIANRRVGPNALRHNFKPRQLPRHIAGQQQYTSGLNGTLSFTGAEHSQTSHLLAAGLSFVGSQLKALSKGLTGTLSFSGSMAKLLAKGLSGSLSFAGSMLRAVSHVLAGALSFAGNLLKLSTRSLSAGLSFAGNIIKSAAKSLSGTLSFTGIFSRIHTGFVAVTGALSFSGSTIKSTTKGLSGALSFAGSRIATTSRSLAAALSFAGSLTKRLTKTAFTATLSFSGSMIKSITRAISGALSFTGAVTSRSIAKLLSGSLSFTGSILRSITHSLAGTLSFAGNLSKRLAKTTFTATLSFAGNLQRAVFKALAAVLSFTGAVTRRIGKALTGVLSFSGSILRAIVHLLAAILSFTGNLTKAVSRAFSGALSFTGSLLTGAVHFAALTASLSFSGGIIKQTRKALAGGLSFVGARVAAITKLMSGSLSFTGGLTRLIARSFSGALSFAGNLTKQIAHALAGGLSFSGAVATLKGAFRNFTAALSFSGNLSRSTGHVLSAALSFSGAVHRTASKLFSSTLSFNNLVPNFGFEGGYGTSTPLTWTVPNWNLTSSSAATIASIDKSVAYQGNQSLKLAVASDNSNNGVNMASLIPVSSGEQYLATIYAMSDTSGQMQIQFSNSLIPTGASFLQSDGVTWGATANYFTINTTSSWQSFTFPITIAAGITGLRISDLKRSGSSSQASRTFWVDNISITGPVLSRVLNRPVAAALSFSGSLARRTVHSLSGTLSFTGNLVKSATRSLAGALSFSGSKLNRIGKALSGTLNLSGGSYYAAVMDAVPYLYWRLNESVTISAIVKDSSGNGRKWVVLGGEYEFDNWTATG